MRPSVHLEGRSNAHTHKQDCRPALPTNSSSGNAHQSSAVQNTGTSSARSASKTSARIFAQRPYLRAKRTVRAGLFSSGRPSRKTRRSPLALKRHASRTPCGGLGALRVRRLGNRGRAREVPAGRDDPISAARAPLLVTFAARWKAGVVLLKVIAKSGPTGTISARDGTARRPRGASRRRTRPRALGRVGVERPRGAETRPLDPTRRRTTRGPPRPSSEPARGRASRPASKESPKCR